MKTKRMFIAFCIIAMSIINHAQAAAPNVTGLRADIYSITAAELFWDRIPNQTLTYEILRDDGQTQLSDGTSYYDSTRTAVAVNVYSATAIGAQGMRSSPTLLTVGPFDQNSLQILHLRADVYSSTTAELFWTRVPNRNLTYEIMRDDGLVNTTQGDRFYDDSRTPGILYDYTVTTIDEQETRSLPATIKVAIFGSETIDSPPRYWSTSYSLLSYLS